MFYIKHYLTITYEKKEASLFCLLEVKKKASIYHGLNEKCTNGFCHIIPITQMKYIRLEIEKL